jgi:hypothetical protein
MNEPLALPKRIVIPRAAFSYCLTLFAAELWDEEETPVLLATALIRRGDKYPLLELEDVQRCLTRVLKTPFWKRRAIAGRWPVHVGRRVAELLLAQRDRAATLEYISGSPRRWRHWLEGDWEQSGPADYHELAPLQLTSHYERWLSGGGSADLGRYLAHYFEALEAGVFDEP